METRKPKSNLENASGRRLKTLTIWAAAAAVALLVASTSSRLRSIAFDETDEGENKVAQVLSKKAVEPGTMKFAAKKDACGFSPTSEEFDGGTEIADAGDGGPSPEEIFEASCAALRAFDPKSSASVFDLVRLVTENAPKPGIDDLENELGLPPIPSVDELYGDGGYEDDEPYDEGDGGYEGYDDSYDESDGGMDEEGQEYLDNSDGGDLFPEPEIPDGGFPETGTDVLNNEIGSAATAASVDKISELCNVPKSNLVEALKPELKKGDIRVAAYLKRFLGTLCLDEAIHFIMGLRHQADSCDLIPRESRRKTCIDEAMGQAAEKCPDGGICDERIAGLLRSCEFEDEDPKVTQCQDRIRDEKLREFRENRPCLKREERKHGLSVDEMDQVIDRARFLNLYTTRFRMIDIENFPTDLECYDYVGQIRMAIYYPDRAFLLKTLGLNTWGEFIRIYFIEIEQLWKSSGHDCAELLAKMEEMRKTAGN